MIEKKKNTPAFHSRVLCLFKVKSCESLKEGPNVNVQALHKSKGEYDGALRRVWQGLEPVTSSMLLFGIS